MIKVGSIVRIIEENFKNTGEQDWKKWEEIKKISTFPIFIIDHVVSNTEYPYYIRHSNGQMGFMSDEVVLFDLTLDIIGEDILL